MTATQIRRVTQQRLIRIVKAAEVNVERETVGLSDQIQQAIDDRVYRDDVFITVAALRARRAATAALDLLALREACGKGAR